MSLNTLISGADCGPVNPLAQMVKHGDADRTLQRDRVGPSSSNAQLRHLPSSSHAGPSSADQAFARQFFEGPSAVAGHPSQQHVAPFQLPRGISPMPMAPSTLHHQPLMQASPSPQVMNDAWARGAQVEGSNEGLSSAWNRGSFSTGQPTGSVVNQTAERRMSYQSGYTGVPQMQWGMQGGFNSSMMMQSQPYISARPSLATSSSPMPQLDWDQEFSRVSEDVKGKGKARIEEVEVSSESKVDDPQMSEFQKAISDMHIGDTSQDELAKWESEYQQVLQSQREAGEELGWQDGEHDFGEEMKRAWETNQGVGLGGDMGLAPLENSLDEARTSHLPILPAYEFEPNNPHLAAPASSLLSQAKEYLANNGSLSEAALLLEAAIQKGELGEGGYEAWILLGETRSMDEREDIGLLALREGVNRAKQAGAVGPGMLSLAVSYTNEAYDVAAHQVLREWLRAKYPSASVPEPEENMRSPWYSHDITATAFIDVARDLHMKGQSDPDVQVGLGILHYADTEYEKAKDCFETALWARPDDYLLWNRLGSCLSNGSKPEEALGVYREALRLRPTYTRAIYNVGVACLNIGAHKEAAEHFLTALSIQKTASGAVPPPDFSEGRSEQLWKTLKKTFSAMQREDLAEMTNQGNVDLFRAEGFEF